MNEAEWYDWWLRNSSAEDPDAFKTDCADAIANAVAVERERIAALFEHTSRPYMGHEIVAKIRDGGTQNNGATAMTDDERKRLDAIKGIRVMAGRTDPDDAVWVIGLAEREAKLCDTAGELSRAIITRIERERDDAIKERDEARARADALTQEQMMIGYSVGAMLEGGQQAMQEDRDRVALLALENGRLRAAAREKLAHDRSEHHGGRCQTCFDVDAKMEAALNK